MFGYSLAIPFLVFLVTDFGGNGWIYGLVGATYSACQLVGAPLLGRWSDRIGRRWVLLVSQAGTAVAWGLFLVALALPVEVLATIGTASLTWPLILVFVARALDGLTGGNISVANAYVADLTVGDPDARGTAFGRMAMAASSGFVLGPAVAGVLGATELGVSLPVALAAAIAVLATVLCVVALTDPPERCPDGPPPPAEVPQAIGQQHKDCSTAPAADAPGWGVVVRIEGIPILIGAAFVQFVAFNLFFASFPVYASQGLSWSAGQLGGFFAVLSGAMLVAQGPVRALAARRASRAVLFGAGQLSLALAFAVLLTGRPSLVYLVAGLYALGNGLAWPTFQAHLADRTPDAVQGAVQGLTTSVTSLGSIVGLLAGGAAYPVLGTGLYGIVGLTFAAMAVSTPLLWRSVARG